MSVSVFVLGGLVVFVGAVMQGVVGMGMNLLAAPLLALVNPALVPVPLLAAGLVLSSLALWRELGHTDWRGAGFAVAGRVPGAVLGTLAVATLPQRSFAVLVGVFVLACVLATMLAWRPSPTSPALVIAGFVGGITGTASSIGAPPVALLYQHDSGARIRATLAAYMLFGGVISLAGLAIGGQIDVLDVWVSLGLLPFLALGFWASTPLRRHLDSGWTRPGVLLLSAGSALFLILRALV